MAKPQYTKDRFKKITVKFVYDDSKWENPALAKDKTVYGYTFSFVNEESKTQHKGKLYFDNTPEGIDKFLKAEIVAGKVLTNIDCTIKTSLDKNDEENEVCILDLGFATEKTGLDLDTLKNKFAK